MNSLHDEMLSLNKCTSWQEQSPKNMEGSANMGVAMDSCEGEQQQQQQSPLLSPNDEQGGGESDEEAIQEAMSTSCRVNMKNEETAGFVFAIKTGMQVFAAGLFNLCLVFILNIYYINLVMRTVWTCCRFRYFLKFSRRYGSADDAIISIYDQETAIGELGLCNWHKYSLFYATQLLHHL